MGDVKAAGRAKEPASDRIMAFGKLKVLLALSKVEPVQAAIALTEDGEGLILLHKTAKPKQVLSMLSAGAGKAKLQLNKSSLRFGRAEVDARNDAGTVRFVINKEAPGTMRMRLVEVVKRIAYQKVEFHVDHALEDEPDDAVSQAGGLAEAHHRLAALVQSFRSDDAGRRAVLAKVVAVANEQITAGQLDAALVTLDKLERALASTPAGSKDGGGSGYDEALRQALPIIQAARALATVSAGAKAPLTVMEAEFDAAVRADAASDAKAATQALNLALGAAKLATAQVAQEFHKRHIRAVSGLGDRAARVAGLAAAPAAVTKAVKAAADARAVAKAEMDGATSDWSTAATAFRGLDRAIAGIDTVCLDEAGKQSAALDRRYKDVDAQKPGGKAIIRAYADCASARKALDARLTAGDGLGALEAGQALAMAVVAFEAAGRPSGTVKRERARAALTMVSALSDRELARRSTKEKAELAFELCANGTPADGSNGLAQLCRLYSKTPPDKAMLKAREAQRAAIIAEVVGMPELTRLYGRDGTFDKAAWLDFTKDPDRVKDLLEQICATQARVLGFPPIPVVKEPDPPEGRDSDGGLEYGGYSPSSNSINLNLHPDALVPIDEALTTILHETFHAHQDVIVRRLKAGEIAEDDPLHATALLYMVNDIPIGYVFPSAGHKNYESQPTEIDAEFQGKRAAEGVLKQLSRNARRRRGT